MRVYYILIPARLDHEEAKLDFLSHRSVLIVPLLIQVLLKHVFSGVFSLFCARLITFKICVNKNVITYDACHIVYIYF